jgi:hypothetical protein
VQILQQLLDGLRSACSEFTDKRKTAKNLQYPMTDIGMAAFSLFFMQCESFLDFQRKMEVDRHASNARTLFKLDKIPTDVHIRGMLDGVEPASLQPCFDDAIAKLEEHDGLTTFTRLDGRLLVALDGTEYFCSQKLNCKNCLKRKRGKDKHGEDVIEYYHSMLCATIVAPGHNRSIHLMPEFIETKDGQDKQDCERNSAKRWLKSDKLSAIAKHRPIILGDALFACQPIAEAVKAVDGADFIFVCKEELNKAVFEFVKDAQAKSCVIQQPKGVEHEYRWVTGVPLRQKDPMTVNWLEITIKNKSGKVTYRSTFITSLAVTAETVAEIAACGRSRWKIENESFNVLKNNGYNLEHNFGHGDKHLAKMFAAMNLLAFTFHEVCDSIIATWRQARLKAGKRTSFFTKLLVVCEYFVFESWDALVTSMITGNPPPLHTSASP